LVPKTSDHVIRLKKEDKDPRKLNTPLEIGLRNTARAQRRARHLSSTYAQAVCPRPQHDAWSVRAPRVLYSNTQGVRYAPMTIVSFC
jgi:hypothetical protein